MMFSIQAITPRKGHPMKSLKMTLALVALFTVAGLAYVAQQTASGPGLVSAAQAFVGALSADQKKQTIYDYASDERTNWNFIPLQDKKKKSTRKGLPLID